MGLVGQNFRTMASTKSEILEQIREAGHQLLCRNFLKPLAVPSCWSVSWQPLHWRPPQKHNHQASKYSHNVSVCCNIIDLLFLQALYVVGGGIVISEIDKECGCLESMVTSCRSHAEVLT